MPCIQENQVSADVTLQMQTKGAEGSWSGRGDSNPRLQLGKLSYYPYTTAAHNAQSVYTTLAKRRQGTPRPSACSRMAVFPFGNQLTWRTRVARTTGDFFCRSANRMALARSM